MSEQTYTNSFRPPCGLTVAEWKELLTGLTVRCYSINTHEDIVGQFNFDMKKAYRSLEECSNYELCHWSKWMRERHEQIEK